MKKVNLNAGRALKILMMEKEISGKELSKAVGVSEATISSLRKNPLISGASLFMLCDYFDMTAAEFIQKGEES